MAANIFTDSGIEIQPWYGQAAFSPGKPGAFPFTRGIYERMYRDKLWTMRQYAGFSTAEASNERYHYLLKQGVTGLSVAFDLPTQIGYDSDDPLAEGEVGKTGVAIDSLEDMEILFDGIDLEKVSTSMTINATAFILLALYIALAQKKGADLKKISGTIQNDILKEYAARGTFIYPPQPSMRLITDIFEYCSLEVPRWNTISISGYHIREAGATAVQELAFTLANGKAYVKAARERGLDIDTFGKRLSFFFNAHNNLFEEVAKFRAGRRLWAKIMQEAGATDPKAMMLRFHTQTGGSTLTAQQPLNNIIRVTIQSIAAVMGGTQSLHTNGFDEALSLPTENAATIALRTQQIIAHESGIADTADPLGGSYYVESLTDELEQRASRLIEQIDNLGGAVRAIELGYMQDEIARSAYAYQQKIEHNEKTVVGVNRFESREDEKQSIPLFRVDDTIREKQKARLATLKQNRNPALAQHSLQEITQKATTSENIMPAVLEAVKNRCTLGEIAGCLRNTWGEYRG